MTTPHAAYVVNALMGLEEEAGSATGKGSMTAAVAKLKAGIKKSGKEFAAGAAAAAEKTTEKKGQKQADGGAAAGGAGSKKRSEAKNGFALILQRL